ncbi:hypothetical protein ACFPRL_16990 [Pseudoclavibacter helvolus]
MQARWRSPRSLASTASRSLVFWSLPASSVSSRLSSTTEARSSRTCRHDWPSACICATRPSSSHTAPRTLFDNRSD